MQPTEGRLLESTTEEFFFAGYHRIELGEKLSLPAGARIGIVVLERVPTADGIKYAVTNTSSLREKAPEVRKGSRSLRGTPSERRGCTSSAVLQSDCESR